MFWIENCEKEAYLTSTEISESQLNYLNKRAGQQSNGPKQLNMVPLSSSFDLAMNSNRDINIGEAMFIAKAPDKEEKFPILQTASPANIQSQSTSNMKTLRMKSQSTIIVNGILDISKIEANKLDLI